jgi:hypothetical protein
MRKLIGLDSPPGSAANGHRKPGGAMGTPPKKLR